MGLLRGKPLAFVSAPQEILNYISRREFEPLLRVDQLNLEREKHKVFLRFSEWAWQCSVMTPQREIHLGLWSHGLNVSSALFRRGGDIFPTHLPL